MNHSTLYSSCSSKGAILISAVLILLGVSLVSHAAVHLLLRDQLDTTRQQRLSYERQNIGLSLHANADSSQLHSSMLLSSAHLERKTNTAIVENFPVSLSLSSSRFAHHPLPQWTKLLQNAKTFGCLITTPYHLSHPCTSPDGFYAVTNKPLRLSSHELPSGAMLLLSTHSLTLQLTTPISYPLEIVAAGPIEIEQLDCTPTVAQRLPHPLYLHSAIGRITIPRTALSCLRQCILQSNALTSVSIREEDGELVPFSAPSGGTCRWQHGGWAWTNEKITGDSQGS